jgi:hypothetical protein
VMADCLGEEWGGVGWGGVGWWRTGGAGEVQAGLAVPVGSEHEATPPARGEGLDDVDVARLGSQGEASKAFEGQEQRVVVEGAQEGLDDLALEGAGGRAGESRWWWADNGLSPWLRDAKQMVLGEYRAYLDVSMLTRYVQTVGAVAFWMLENK